MNKTISFGIFRKRWTIDDDFYMKNNRNRDIYIDKKKANSIFLIIMTVKQLSLEVPHITPPIFLNNKVSEKNKYNNRREVESSKITCLLLYWCILPTRIQLIVSTSQSNLLLLHGHREGGIESYLVHSKLLFIIYLFSWTNRIQDIQKPIMLKISWLYFVMDHNLLNCDFWKNNRKTWKIHFMLKKWYTTGCAPWIFGQTKIRDSGQCYMIYISTIFKLKNATLCAKGEFKTH